MAKHLDLIQIIVLALVQGLTEFLPISSSAHLILVPLLTEWEDQGLAFDVAVHVGTLLAVVFYFRKQLADMAVDWFGSLPVISKQAKQTDNSRLAWAVLFGTIPVGLCGLLFNDFIKEALRGALVIAATQFIFAAYLWWADAKGRRERDEYSIRWKDVLIIGIAQAIALIPGTSRSGITISAALMLGLTRDAAARFSFLLSIPVIVLAGGLETLHYLSVAKGSDFSSLITGAVISGISAYLCIHYFLKLLDKIGMMPFVIYRFSLGAVLLVLFI